jgi:hypothetical protein
MATHRRAGWQPTGWSAMIAALLLIFVAPASAKQQGTVVPVSADPYSDPGAQHATEVEPDSFANESTVVSAFQVGRRDTSGASNNGVATSHDGGHRFTSGFLPGITKVAGGPYDWASDPSVAYDAAHRLWLISSLVGTATPPPFPGAAVIVSSSPDGVHWNDPITVADGGSLGGLDKNWTTCDNSRQSPFYGHCYTEFDDFLDNVRLKMSTSTDGGQTWGPAVETAGAGRGFAGQPVVQPDGTVVVPSLGPAVFPATNNLIQAFRSTDGGSTWTAPVTVSQFSFHRLPGLRAGSAEPSAELDRTGNVYLVWEDCRFRASCSADDLVLSKSANGLDWTPPARIPIDPVDSGADHFIPGLAVDPHTAGDHARLALTYYAYPQADCVPATCDLDVGFISSAYGGATWGTPRKLAGPMRLDWLADTNRGRFVGDYVSTSFMHELAFPFFAEANAPTDGAFDEAIATVSGGLHVVGGPGK